jgi:hypothetical protein
MEERLLVLAQKNAMMDGQQLAVPDMSIAIVFQGLKRLLATELEQAAN